MAVESAFLIKAITPIIAAVAKESANFLKESKIRWDANKTIEKLSKMILDINTVRTMWSRDKSVLIDTFYYPPKITSAENEYEVSEAESRQLSFDDILKQNSVIEGIVGQGKSILFRQLCNLTIKQLHIPIFIELRYIADDRSLESLILDYMDAAGINGGKPIFNHLATNKNIVLILDGFDEIQKNQVKNCIYEIEQLRKKFENLRILISSRPHYGVQNLAGFEIYRIAELTSEDYGPFLRKLIPDTVIRFNIEEALKNAPKSIIGVVTTPLMLSLLCVVYAQEGDIPSSLPTFYERLFNAVFIKHDNFKPGFNREHFSKLSESNLQKLFDAFCFMTIRDDHGRTLTREEFEASFEKAKNYTPNLECDIEGFKKDIVKVACLMLDDGYDQTSFLHKSIAEYHAASFIKRSSESFVKKFYEQAINNETKWLEPLKFLRHIDEFRYASLYIMKTYPAELQCLSKTLNTGTSAALNDYIGETLSEFTINMDGMEISSFSLGTRGNGRHRGFFATQLVSALASASTHALFLATNKKIAAAKRDSNPGVSKPMTINYQTYVAQFDTKMLWDALKTTEQNGLKELERCQVVIEIENRKDDIF